MHSDRNEDAEQRERKKSKIQAAYCAQHHNSKSKYTEKDLKIKKKKTRSHSSSVSSYASDSSIDFKNIREIRKLVKEISDFIPGTTSPQILQKKTKIARVNCPRKLQKKLLNQIVTEKLFDYAENSNIKSG